VLQIKQIPIAAFKPYERNARTHSDTQIKQIAASISEFGFVNPILVDTGYGVIAGHGRLEAAKALGMSEAPAIVLNGLTEVQVKALRLADNKIAQNSGWDTKLLSVELGEIQALDFDVAVIGFDDLSIAALNDQTAEEQDQVYTRKITSPVYEVKGNRPKVSDLYDTSKTAELVAEIDAAKLPIDLAAYLKAAAQRHTVVDFAKSAEFYAHADAKVQHLMENQALVIIDFKRAIELGFVKLTAEIAAQYIDESNGE
jgi:hypothetical protein